MPRAEIFVTADGSTRCTVAGSGGPPQLSIRAFAPGLISTASRESTSTTISTSPGSPISISGVPAGTTCSLSVSTRRMRPVTGALISVQQGPSLDPFSISAASARSSSFWRTSSEALALSSAAAAVETSSRALSRARSEMVPWRDRRSARSSSVRMKVSCASACFTSAAANPTLARAEAAAASATRFRRASSSPGAAGRSDTTTVSSCTTASPG